MRMSSACLPGSERKIITAIKYTKWYKFNDKDIIISKYFCIFFLFWDLSLYCTLVGYFINPLPIVSKWSHPDVIDKCESGLSPRKKSHVCVFCTSCNTTECGPYGAWLRQLCIENGLCIWSTYLMSFDNRIVIILCEQICIFFHIYRLQSNIPFLRASTNFHGFIFQFT